MGRKNNLKKRIIYSVACFTLFFQQIGFAQVASELNIAGHLARMHSSISIDKFRPLHLRYFSYDLNSDNFKFLFDKGDLKQLEDGKFKELSAELLKYFLIGIALPDSKFWVNLRPDSEDQIIEPELEQTDMGKVLLEADLQLKKDTAKYTSPETPEGREYWNKLYKKAEELFGYDAITIPTLTRPWIVPGEIIVRETSDSSFIYKSTLKVCLEQDYLKNSVTYSFKDERLKALNVYSSQLIRELIIPKLTKEVNISKKYAALRQVFYSLILSRWFKARYAGKSSFYASLIDSNNLNGLTSKESWSKTTYFKEYQKSFNNGEYNIKEPVYTPTGQVIRSYFSGGIKVTSETTSLTGFAGGADGPNLYVTNPNFISGTFIPSKDMVLPPLIKLQGGIDKDGKKRVSSPIFLQEIKDFVERLKWTVQIGKEKTTHTLHVLYGDPEKDSLIKALLQSKDRAYHTDRLGVDKGVRHFFVISAKVSPVDLLRFIYNQLTGLETHKNLPLDKEIKSTIRNKLDELDKGVAGSAIALKTYLTDTKRAFTELLELKGEKPVVRIVLGNEAGDLDSTVSSLTYALLKYQQAVLVGQPKILAVPFLNIFREEFRLRTEVVYWLEQFGISEDDLLFKGELNVSELQRKGFDVRVTLVDHNKLAEGQEYLQPLVGEVIDHHSDEKQFDADVSRELAPVGSNTTLIAERILSQKPELLTPELAEFLLGPVLLDTINLDTKAGRVTERDRQIAVDLLVKAGVDRDAIFQALQTAKFDLSRLDFKQILSKDYKYYSGAHLPYGISSIQGLSLVPLLAKTKDPIEDLEYMLDDRQVNAIVGMLIFEEEGVYKRELFIYANSASLLSQLIAFLQNIPSLQLQELSGQLEIPRDRKFAAFSTSTDFSRKVLEPKLKEFFSAQASSPITTESREKMVSFIKYSIAKYKDSVRLSMMIEDYERRIIRASLTESEVVLLAKTATAIIQKARLSGQYADAKRDDKEVQELLEKESRDGNIRMEKIFDIKSIALWLHAQLEFHTLAEDIRESDASDTQILIAEILKSSVENFVLSGSSRLRVGDDGYREKIKTLITYLEVIKNIPVPKWESFMINFIRDIGDDGISREKKISDINYFNENVLPQGREIHGPAVMFKISHVLEEIKEVLIASSPAQDTLTRNLNLALALLDKEGEIRTHLEKSGIRAAAAEPFKSAEEELRATLDIFRIRRAPSDPQIDLIRYYAMLVESVVDIVRRNPQLKADALTGLESIQRGMASEYSIFAQTAARRAIEKIRTASSAVQAPEITGGVDPLTALRVDSPNINPGGIDFRVMNIVTQPLVSSSSLNLKLPQLANLAKIDLDEELQQIQNMLRAGIIPSGERIKEYLAACQGKGEWDNRIVDIISCLVEICRLEEDNVSETPIEIKETLIIADSGNLGS